MPKTLKIPYALFSIILLLFMVLSAIHYRPSPKYIEWSSLEIASSLVKNGSFTNGGRVTNDISGYDKAPGYPALIALIAQFSPTMSKELDCLSTKHRKCNDKSLIRLLIAVQILAALVTLFMVFFLAWELSYSIEISVLTVLFFLFSGGLTKFSLSLLPFVFVTLSMITSSTFLIWSFRRKLTRLTFFAGTFAGLSALFYPPFILVPLFISTALLLNFQTSFRHRLRSAIAFISGAAIVLAPWIMRNFYLFDDLAIAHNSSIQALASRVAYNAMSLNELLASFLIWIPNFGESLAGLFFSNDIIDRFGYGKSSILGEYKNIIAETKISGQTTGHYGRIISTFIFGDIIRYMATLPSLLLHGFWGGTTLGIIGIAYLVPLLKRLRCTNNTRPFLLIFSSLASCILAQAMIGGTLNPHHYNSQIVFIHAYAIAYVTGGLEIPKILHKKDRPSYDERHLDA